MFGAAKLGDRNSWLLLLFLALAVVLPTSALLWFMNDAARSQAQAARQSVNEAYRGQLGLLRERLDAEWQARIAATQRAAGEGAPANFPLALAASGADAVLFLDAAGHPGYPIPPAAAGTTPLFPSTEWGAAALESQADQSPAIAAYTRIANSAKNPVAVAIAAQSLVRCLVRSGRKDAALEAIAKYFADGAVARATDFDGHSIAADEQLLALHLMKRTDRRFLPASQRLAGLLNSYKGVPIPSAQRIFIWDELQVLAPELPPPATESAERLCQLYLDAERPRPGTPRLQPTAIAGLWKITSPDSRVIALYRTATIRDAVLRTIAGGNTSRLVEFSVTAPGAAGPQESAAAGELLPGWLIGYDLLDAKPSEEAARRRTETYLLVGYLVIAGVVVAGLVLAQTVRRQMRLAHLKTDLVTTVSHELKTPLTSTRLLVETLLEDHVPAETAREYLQLIAGENLRLTRLVENFLTFSRIERSRQRFDFTEINPGEVVESALLSLRERVQAKACQLDVDVSPNLPLLHADRDALVTVLLNLLDNACKYAPVETHLSVRAYRSERQVVFAVQDNGIGIAAREHKRIFRRFYQVDRRLTRETGGCGLGLSIVDFIVRAHGGEVIVQSAPGAGSTFSVLLPCCAAPNEAGA